LNIFFSCWATQIMWNQVIPMQEFGHNPTSPTPVSITGFNSPLNMLGDRSSCPRCAGLTHARNTGAREDPE
jgi:hypothetical protein